MENELAKKLKSEKVIAQFETTAGKNAAVFASEVAITVMGNSALEKASLASVVVEATKASALGLSLLPTVGEAYLVPYKGQAQFQLGYKGLVQLAMRSGQMKSFGTVKVYEGENPRWDKYSQELHTDGEETGEVVGYYAQFTLINGFKKADYWTKSAVEEHRSRFSKSKSGPWATDFDAMAQKTVLKSILQYAPKSSEMTRAMASEDMNGDIADGTAKPIDITPDDNKQKIEEQVNKSQSVNTNEIVDELNDYAKEAAGKPKNETVSAADAFFN